MIINDLFPKPIMPYDYSKDERYKRIEIKQFVYIPKGETCNGCMFYEEKIKQLINIMGDPTRQIEEPYCNLYRTQLFPCEYKYKEDYCCANNMGKCWLCKLNIERNGEKEND